MRAKFSTLFLFTFFLILSLTLSDDSSSDSPKPHKRLRRPSKRLTTSTIIPKTDDVPAATEKTKLSTPTRSRFRIKNTSSKSTSSSLVDDQIPAGSIASRSVLPRVKSSTKSSSSSNSGKDYKIVCYYTNWSQYRPKVGKFLPEDIPADLCTHIIFSFGWMKKGKLSSFETNDETKDGKPGFYERINKLKEKNPDLKTLLAIGGWSFGTAKFKEMSATRYSRQTFIFSAIPYLRDRKFDGLDIDWEYPKGSEDKKNYVSFLKELKEAFSAEAEETGRERLLLSAAVPVGPDSIRGGYDVPAVNSYLDFINLMAYDFHGKWESQTGHNAPLYAPSSDSEWRKQLSVDNAAKTWVKLGAAKNKLVIGMPTYGRSFQLADKSNHSVNVATKGGGTAGIYTKESGFLAYYEICEILSGGGDAKYVWDSEMKVPYMVSDDQWVGFDDERAIRNKMSWIKNEGYGGAMVWSVDMDDFTGTVCPGGVKYPLIGAMREELRGVKRAGVDVDWEKIAGSPAEEEEEDEEEPVKKTPQKIDVKELLASANKKRIKTQTPLAKVEDTKTRSPALMCFVTSWSNGRRGKGKYSISNIDPKLCTHVVYAYAKLKDNKLAPASESDLDEEGTFAKLQKLKEINPDVKILISLGGGASGTKPFQTLTSNVYRMNNFVYGATEFLRENNFDGLDVDWEYPKGSDERESHLNLIKELRLAFEGETKTSKLGRLLLTVSLPPIEEALLDGYDIPELSQFVDYFNLMSYDFHSPSDLTVGHNSPLFPIDSSPTSQLTLSASGAYLKKSGAPAEKILIGLPTFGRSFQLENPSKFDIGAGIVGKGSSGKYTNEDGFLAYYEICNFLQKDNTTLVWDNEQSVPFAYNGAEWVGFDDERSFKSKGEWLKSGDFGGVMIWSLDLDDFSNECGTGKYPLLTSIHDELKDYKVKLSYKGPYEGTGGNGGSKGKKDPNEVTCEEEDGHISYHADKGDCSKYFMCEGERKHHMPCPANLVFNPDQNVCDWAENVESCKDFVKT